METNIIYNEDCLEGMKKLPSESVDLVVTSPPYDNIRSYGSDIDKTWGEEVWKPIIQELYRVLKKGGVCVWIVADATINGSETGTSFKQALYFMEQGFKLHDTMIWEKISPFIHPNRYIQNFEYMFVFSKDEKPKTTHIICDRKNKCGGQKIHGTLRQKDGRLKQTNGYGKEIKEYGARFNTWNIPAEKNNDTGHPAVFPFEIAKDHIISWSNEGDIILDPFMGSGTTAIACIKEHRNFIGFELNEEYFNKANERIANELSQPTLF